VGNVHGGRSADAQSELPSQYDGLALPRAAPGADHGDRWSRGHHCDRQYIRTARSRELCGLRTYESGERILAEAMARDLGPKGVHVAYIVIDAVIDVPWARERFKTKPDDFFIAPAAIADEAWHVANQPRSAWSFNVEVRPYGETW